MSYHTTEQEFGPFGQNATARRLVVDANGGSVAVKALLTGSTYITFDTITSDDAKMIEVAGCKIQITPTGGATYNFGAGS